jgi:hypothetical protein
LRVVIRSEEKSLVICHWAEVTLFTLSLRAKRSVARLRRGGLINILPMLAKPTDCFTFVRSFEFLAISFEWIKKWIDGLLDCLLFELLLSFFSASVHLDTSLRLRLRDTR